MPQTFVFADLLRDYLTGKLDANQKKLLYEMVSTGNYDQIISTEFNESWNESFFLQSDALTTTAKEKLFKVILNGISKQLVFHKHKDPHFSLRWWVLCFAAIAALASIYIIIK